MQVEAGVKARPKRDREATRQRLLDAARDLFGEHGYDGVTVRMIAASGNANVALVNRYFGSKAALFGEVLEGESDLRAVIAGRVLSRDGVPLARRLAEHFVRQVYRGPTTTLSRIMDRSVGNPEVKEIVREHMNRVLVEPLVEQLDGPSPGRGRSSPRRSSWAAARCAACGVWTTCATPTRPNWPTG